MDKKLEKKKLHLKEIQKKMRFYKRMYKNRTPEDQPDGIQLVEFCIIEADKKIKELKDEIKYLKKQV